MVEEQISFPICHINIVSGCFIIIIYSMSARGCLKIFVVQEKGEQGSGGGGAVISQRWSQAGRQLGVYLEFNSVKTALPLPLACHLLLLRQINRVYWEVS